MKKWGAKKRISPRNLATMSGMSSKNRKPGVGEIKGLAPNWTRCGGKKKKGGKHNKTN